MLSYISLYPILYRIFCCLYRIFYFNLYCNTNLKSLCILVTIYFGFYCLQLVFFKLLNLGFVFALITYLCFYVLVLFIEAVATAIVGTLLLLLGAWAVCLPSCDWRERWRPGTGMGRGDFFVYLSQNSFDK